MKKIVVTILLSIFTLVSYAQNEGLYVDGMKWVCGHYMFVKKDSVRVYNYLYTYVINGDTLINDIKYKKMFQSWRYLNRDYDKSYVNRKYFCRYENGKYLFYLPGYKDRSDWEPFIGDDYVFFDENLKAGDTWLSNPNEKIAYIADTVFNDSKDKVRKYWKMLPYLSTSSRYREAMNYVLWIEGVGSPCQPMPYIVNEYDCACYNMVLYCINPVGDTIYRNQKYIDLVDFYYKTNVPQLASNNISFSQHGNECVIALPTDVEAWSATLYNSVGVVVARRSGEGSEIVLPATSKGTHIIEISAGGKVVRKKVFIK